MAYAPTEEELVHLRRAVELADVLVELSPKMSCTCCSAD